MLEWGKMWSNDDYHWKTLKVIRVRAEYTPEGELVRVANATNGRLWLRRPINSDTPNGVYSVGLDGGLSAIHNFKGPYPDLEIALPDFSKMKTIAKFNIQDLTKIAQSIRLAKDNDLSYLEFRSDGMVVDIKEDDERDLLNRVVEPLVMPTIEEPLSLRIENLELVINEMLYYQHMEVRMMIEQDTDRELVAIGTSPYSCGLLSTNPSKVFS